ncbi:MAG: hypothetical protein ACOC5J_02035 [Gemmatimonadota bacterium]
MSLLLFLLLALVACESQSSIVGDDEQEELPPGPLSAESLWFGGDREAENEIRAGGVVPVWFRVSGPRPDPDETVSVRVVSGETIADLTLEPMRLLDDGQVCALASSAGGAILVFQEGDGSDPTDATSDAVRQELSSLGAVLREEFRDGVSATLPADPDVIGKLREHPNIRSIRPLPFPSWPAVLIDPVVAADPPNWYGYERWGMVDTGVEGPDSGCGHSPGARVPTAAGATIEVRYRQPDGELLSETAEAVATLSEPDVQACLTDVAALQIEDQEARAIDVPDPGSLPPWETHDASLAAWFAEGNGHGGIGFKESDSPPSQETGIRAAVSAATIREGLESVCERGGRLVNFRESTGSAHVQIPPEIAPQVREDSLTDYLEPSLRAGPGPGDPRFRSRNVG